MPLRLFFLEKFPAYVRPRLIGGDVLVSQCRPVCDWIIAWRLLGQEADVGNNDLQVMMMASGVMIFHA
jgi:hypothetical protein